jgi:nicotinamidase-related amidase
MSTPEAVRVGIGRLDARERPALVLVDCQRLFTLGGTPGSPLDTAVRAAAAAAEAARERGVPVIWLRTLFERDEDLGPVWRAKAPALAQLRPGSELADWDPRMGFRDGEVVITKKRASGFVGTSLHEVLTGMDVFTLAVAGLTTAGCVRATVVDAASLDYAPVVLADATADRSGEIHEAGLLDLDARYADVVRNSADWWATIPIQR